MHNLAGAPVYGLVADLWLLIDAVIAVAVGWALLRLCDWIDSKLPDDEDRAS